jgi:voltage-gated potassium channel
MPDVRQSPYEFFALALSIFALVMLGVSASVTLDSESSRLVNLCDLLLCGFFFLDFLRSLSRAPNKLRYLYTWGWLDLAASIPAVDALRLGRLGRIVRILRVLRVIKAGRVLVEALSTRRRESAGWAALLVSILVVFTAAIAMLQLEREVGNIQNAEDALWWALTTITTVGYGDRYPVTTEGRMVAVGLMAVGVGLVGTLSGMAASWFMQAER